ncbi:hypothetical protein Psfp_04180 [Pelotomaculum sp. FP]|uniref:O-antigen ligase family protein n=1 Tax=Pelotomaculum sp. FP TaxID=261474 RepID=UPI00106568DD|nr:O-antigen ligase family protein [Pelotomaculum sp. FP]TEB10365.1 hypothetical protein Psfp_04180 [Pelotomaculum sp. FP]
MVAAKSKNKKKIEAVKSNLQNNQLDLGHAIAFWGMGVLLFLPPYFRGLFFQPEQERALFFATVLFGVAWLWKWSKRDNSFLSHPLDYFVLAFPIVYLISAFQAANYGLAVDEVVKTALYFMVYWLSSRLVRNDKDIVTILHIIYISAVGVALAGLATATGIIEINDGFLNGRIYSSFQYPNALASYLAAVIFIGLYLWRKTSLQELDGVVKLTISKYVPAWLNLNNISHYLYAAGNFLLFAVLLGTKSYGGLLVFSLVFVLFIIGLSKCNRIPVILHFALIGMSSTIAIWQFLSAVSTQKMVLAWLWIFIGLTVTLTGQFLYLSAEKRGICWRIEGNKKITIGILLLVVIVLAVGLGYYLNTHPDIVKKITEQIILKFRNAIERFYFYHDAMKMFRERSIIGWGGGGWQEAYRAFQGYFYTSNQVHGNYFQIMVEAGALGLLTILGIWVTFLYIANRLYHGAKEDVSAGILIWTITIAALSVGAHAVIDFDLSLSALSMVLWTLFGLARGILSHSTNKAEEKNSRRYVPPNNAVLVGASVVTVLLLIFSGALVTSSNSYTNAKHAKSYDQALALLQKASVYNPTNATYHLDPVYRVDLAHLYLAQGKMDQSIAEACLAVKLSQYNDARYADLSVIYVAAKKNDEAVQAAHKALSLAPFEIQRYELLSQTYFVAGYNELNDDNRDAAKQYFEQVAGVPAKIQRQIETIDEEEKRLWKDAPPMTVTPTVKLYLGSSQYLLGKWAEADSNLQAALADNKTKGAASLWLAALRDKQGQVQESQDLLVQASKLSPELANKYDQLKSLPILK